MTENEIYFAVSSEEEPLEEKFEENVIYNIEETEPLDVTSVIEEANWYKADTYFKQLEALEYIDNYYGFDLLFFGFGTLDSTFNDLKDNTIDEEGKLVNDSELENPVIEESERIPEEDQNVGAELCEKPVEEGSYKVEYNGVLLSYDIDNVAFRGKQIVIDFVVPKHEHDSFCEFVEECGYTYYQEPYGEEGIIQVETRIPEEEPSFTSTSEIAKMKDS